MKIAFDSELMENQKHAVVMSPDLAFDVLQSQEGDSLFFSIGTDNSLYLTREVTQSATGWNKVDLSSALSAQHGGAPVAAKAFAIAQNAQTQNIDLALILTVSGTDYLYLSLGNANTDADWATGVTWDGIVFDAGTAPSPLTIADVFLMNITAVGGSGAVENIFVDILRTPGDPLKILDRYYIQPGSSPQWNKQTLAADLASGSISSCLGQRTKDPIPGIYTFGMIGTEKELIFTPQYNYFNPQLPPNPAKLGLPGAASDGTGGDASAIASAVNSAGVSNLFVAGNDGLYLFTPDNQGDVNAIPTPIQIVTASVVAGASSLTATTTANQTAVWGLDPQGSLFYLTCSAGRESDSSAWSNPAPLLTGVEGFSFFLNINAGTNTLFAHTDGQNLVQLTQDPVTTDWIQRNILLPSTSPNDMAVYKSYTTHIQITDANGVAAPNTAAALTATSPVSVYVNDVYYRLSATVPVNVVADATGVLTVIQETQSLAGICFQIALTDGSGLTADINPMSKAMTTLASVQNGDDMGAVQVTNADGTQQPLVPTSVSANDRDAAAKSLVNFVQINSGLPQNGSRQTPATAPRLELANAADVSPTPSTATFPPVLWGVSFASGGLEYHEGADIAERFGLRLAAPNTALAANAPQLIGSVGSDIQIAAGDLFQWLKDAYDDVEHFVVQAAEGVYHFLAKIGDVVYDAVLDCVDAVIHAVEFVFNKIAVFFEDLIKWLGFLFQWGDILLTHRVIKNVLKQCAARAVNQIVALEDDVKSVFQGIESKVDAWANIPNATDTVGSYQSNSSSAPSYGSPQSNWALHHAKGNASAATTPYSTPIPDMDPLQQIFDDLEKMVDAEIDDLKNAVQRLKTEVIDQIASLTASEAMAKVAAIITDAILTTAENIVVTSLDIIKVVVDGIIDLLDAPISIPILSSIYHDITGDDLSFLDLVCLIAAIPATIIYKAAVSKAPFSESDANALSSASDYAALQTLLTGSATPSTNAVKLLATGSSAEASAVAPTLDASALLATLGIVADFAAMFGAFAVAIFAVLKKTETEAGMCPPAPLRYLAACSYLPYVAPDLIQAFTVGSYNAAGKGFIAANDIVTTVAIAKTLADNAEALCSRTTWANYISPVAESLLNIVWLIPAAGVMCETDSPKTSDWLSFAGNMVFDLGGAITFAAEEKIMGEPPVALGFFVAIEALTAAYGLLSVGTGIALLD